MPARNRGQHMATTTTTSTTTIKSKRRLVRPMGR